ncbi:hypothetical protein NP493_307g01030 [Ridgeia piscesae]|uniref:Uncharacterized protein n=1 Tax=Ridgeia piscesae TaxID=27915 RepID=A0AAD9L776_RIDPI|nr:hypothetical protein NP493_307g01030 [Ridgeia piscesae]
MNSLVLLVVLLVGVAVSRADRMQECLDACEVKYRQCLACPETENTMCKANKKLCNDSCWGLYGGGDEDYEDVF